MAKKTAVSGESLNKSNGPLADAITRVSNSISSYSRFPGAVRPGDSIGLTVVGSLKRLALLIEASLPDLSPVKHHVSISRGQGNLPRILYIAISRRAGVLSVEPSVTLCFSEDGQGFVVGMMYSKLSLKRNKQPVIRSGKKMAVTLSSARSRSNFDDLFVNPMECLVSDFDSRKFLDHISISLKLLQEEYR